MPRIQLLLPPPAACCCVQVGEQEPFISELLTGLTITIQDLESHQIHMFYEAVGMMIAADTGRWGDVKHGRNIGGRQRLCVPLCPAGVGQQYWHTGTGGGGGGPGMEVAWGCV